MARDRFIPYRATEVVRMCADEVAPDERLEFEGFARLLGDVIHLELRSELERLKRCYAPFNPDADTRRSASLSADVLRELRKELVQTLTHVLEAANFERVTRADLDRSLNEESLFRIRLHAEFDDFEEVLLFCRGGHRRRETLVSLFGLRKKDIEFTNYDRVAVFVQFKGPEHFARDDRKLTFCEPGSTIIKLFQNVPEADLEMLFPNTEVRMKTIDKVVLGVPAAVGGLVLLVTKLGTTLLLVGSAVAFWLGLSDQERVVDQEALIALGLGLATLGGFLFRQIMKFKNRKIQFMKVLTENLYFKNLDNNAGVFHHVLDAAEESEHKEAVLAYVFLATRPNLRNEADLDRTLERWFAEKWGCTLDFDAADALAKLKRLGLLTGGPEALSVLPVPEARDQLVEIWRAHALAGHGETRGSLGASRIRPGKAL